MNKLICLALISSLNFTADAEVLKVAAASNFAETIKVIGHQFEQQTGHELLISAASTGKLYAQIKQGAPYDVFLSADTKTALKLTNEQLAVNESLRPYALGQLVLLSNQTYQTQCQEVLQSDGLRHLAIANPKTAPYGLAAQQTLEQLGLWQDLSAKLVMGENIAQAMHFVSSKNAGAGFVALSLLKKRGLSAGQCAWLVPAEMHQPIQQSMVILNAAKNRPVVAEFYQFMDSDEAKKTINSMGYADPQ